MKNKKSLIAIIILICLSIFFATRLISNKKEIVLLNHTIFSKEKEIDELKKIKNSLSNQIDELKNENEILEYHVNSYNQTETTPPTEGIAIINPEELERKVNAKETFILLITQDKCPHCMNFKPKMDKILKEHHILAYEINNTALKTNPNLSNTFSISGTPTTIFIKDGVETSLSNRLIGNVSEEKINEKLRDTNYIQ